MQRGGGMPDGPASDAGNADSLSNMTKEEACPAISKRGRQLRQVEGALPLSLEAFNGGWTVGS